MIAETFETMLVHNQPCTAIRKSGVACEFPGYGAATEICARDFQGFPVSSPLVGVLSPCRPQIVVKLSEIAGFSCEIALHCRSGAEGSSVTLTDVGTPKSVHTETCRINLGDREHTQICRINFGERDHTEICRTKFLKPAHRNLPHQLRAFEPTEICRINFGHLSPPKFAASLEF